jgi:hypothetical protein
MSPIDDHRRMGYNYLCYRLGSQPWLSWPPTMVFAGSRSGNSGKNLDCRQLRTKSSGDATGCSIGRGSFWGIWGINVIAGPTPGTIEMAARSLIGSSLWYLLGRPATHLSPLSEVSPSPRRPCLHVSGLDPKVAFVRRCMMKSQHRLAIRPGEPCDQVTSYQNRTTTILLCCLSFPVAAAQPAST